MTAFHGKCCGDPECGYGTRSEPPEPKPVPRRGLWARLRRAR